MSRDLQTLNSQNKLALWAGRILECRSSGQNVKAWCKENGICEQTYYKWQKRLFDAYIQKAFCYIKIRKTLSAITIKVNGPSVEKIE